MFQPILGAMDTFLIAYTQSDFFGKLIMLALIGLSMLCWILLLHKAWIVRQVSRLSQSFQKTVEQNKETLLNLQTQPSHPFATIFTALKNKTVEVLNKNHYFLSQNSPSSRVYLTTADLELLESHVATHISAQSKLLEKNLYLLSTIVTLAPFMGLLGTVWGILVTFAGLHEGGSIGSNTSILGGISTALATTVLGLIIAIPALIAYNYLKNSLRHYTSDMEDFLAQLLSQLELQYRKVE